MSHVRVTVDQGFVACSPSLPEMVSVDLRPLEEKEPLTVAALDGLKLKDDATGTVKVGAVSEGLLEVHVERRDVVLAVLRGLRVRLEAPVLRGEAATVRAGHAPQ